MRRRYVEALVVSLAGVATLLLAIFGYSTVFGLVIASVAFPLAVLLVVAGRMGREPPWAAAAGGGSIGPAVGILGHGIVFAFAYAFFLGFAEQGVALLEALRIDPRFTAAIGSPWVTLLFVEVVIVAPLIEEFGKALGSRLCDPDDRRTAFLAGVAAGAAFAAVENVLYATGGGFFGPPWEAIVTQRILGMAVHPLASGLVVMGVWEWRRQHDAGRLAARFFAGAGIHALWNGSLVVLLVASTAYDLGGTGGAYPLVSLVYAAGLGALAAAVLWRVAGSLADDEERLMVVDSRDGRVVAGWVVLAASFMVPVAMLVLAYPGFVGAG